jgi:hypothetical protein
MFLGVQTGGNALTKEELLNGLNNLLNNFLYGFICPTLVTPEVWSEASRRVAVFKGREREIEIQLGLRPPEKVL